MMNDDLRDWPDRVRFAWGLVNQPGGLALVLVVVGLLLYTGYLPSPLVAGLARVEATVTAQGTSMRELAQSLDRLAEALERRNRRDAARDCDQIKDAELRHLCAQ